MNNILVRDIDDRDISDLMEQAVQKGISLDQHIHQILHEKAISLRQAMDSNQK